MIKTVQRFEDSQGCTHKTYEAALRADECYLAKEKEDEFLTRVHEYCEYYGDKFLVGGSGGRLMKTQIIKQLYRDGWFKD
jgi:hypothetical protein